MPIETATSPEALRLAASTAGAMDWRYALKHLNPFVVQGDASIYEPHNANGELTLHGLADDRARASEMNPEWLQARAEMLVWMVRRNDADREYAHSTQGEPTRYIGAGSAGAGTALNFLVARAPDAAITHVVRFGGPAAERFNGDLYDDRLFGGAGADQIAGMSGADYLQGDAGADRLLGGAGNDTLFGGRDADVLAGGAGADEYRWVSGDGWDVIRDNTSNSGSAERGDGQGVIVWNGAPIGAGITPIGQSRTRFTDGVREYLFSGVPGARGRLRIFEPGAEGGLIVERFRNGELGITLPGMEEPAELPVTTRNIRGDLSQGNDDLGNPTSGPQAGRNDYIFGGPQNDRIQTFGGSDRIYGQGRDPVTGSELGGSDGSDVVFAGPGDDYVQGWEGDDWVFGQAGRDQLLGWYGNDRIYAGERIADDQLDGLNGQQGSGALGEWLEGHFDDDTLVGGADNDNLLGGEGKDILYGGGGDDNLFGDLWTLGEQYPRPVIVPERDPRITRQISTSQGGVRHYDYFIDDAWTEEREGDDDIIEAGRGADWVFAGGGDDFVDAGDDADVVFGGRGNDNLLGGAGADDLSGDDGVWNGGAGGGNDVIDGGAGRDSIFGDAGDDTLYGGDDQDPTQNDDVLYGDGTGIVGARHGADWIEGGAGNDSIWGDGSTDVLFGGTGTDLLVGGLGNDLYRWSSGDGWDTLIDDARASGDQVGDGQGRIVWNGRTLGGTLTAIGTSRTRFVDEEGLEYRFAGLAGARGSLTISAPGGLEGIVIASFGSGDPCIQLPDRSPAQSLEVMPPTPRTCAGHASAGRTLRADSMNAFAS